MDDSKTQREQRLAAALRANLHRRKQQARERGRAESDAPRDVSPRDPADTGSAAPDAGGSDPKT